MEHIVLAMTKHEAINILIKETIRTYYCGSETDLDTKICALLYPQILSIDEIFEIESEISERVNEIILELNSIPFEKNSYEIIKTKFREAIEQRNNIIKVTINKTQYEFTIEEGKYILDYLQFYPLINGIVIPEAIYDRIHSANPNLSERDIAIVAIQEFEKRREDLQKPFEDAITLLTNHKTSISSNEKIIQKIGESEDSLNAIEKVILILKSEQERILPRDDLPF